MKKENWTEGMGNEGLRGYSIDLIDEIAKLLNFRYEFYLVADGQYGSLKNGQWNGLIKDLLDRVGDRPPHTGLPCAAGDFVVSSIQF